MIVCKQCGHHNADSDTFCGSCGKFLEWSGERVAVAEPESLAPAAEAAPEPEPARPGLLERVKQAVGIEESSPNPAAPIAPDLPLRAVPVSSSASAPRNAAEPVLAGVATPLPNPPPATAAGPSGNSDEPLSRRPTSVAPALARPRTAPRTMEQPARRHPGDLICGQCGEGNDPTRHFCRRCGSELAEAVAVQLPWYRRWWNRVFPGRTREAGWRPTRVGAPNVTGIFVRVLRLAIIAVVLLFALAFLLVPPFHNTVVTRASAAFTTVRKTIHPNLDPVHPVSATATTSIPNHPASLAIDTFTNTYWAASAADRQPVLIINFSGPVDLAEIGVTSGAAGTAPQDQFLAQPRPHQLHLVFSNGYTTDVTLTDSNKAQFNAIEAKQVTSMELHILSVYAPAGAAPASAAIAEVEFKTKN